MANELIPKELDNDVRLQTTEALALDVNSDETLVRADGYLVSFKLMEKRIKEFFQPMKSKAHAAWREICDKEGEELDKLIPAITHIKNEIGTYKREQDRKRRIEEERQREENKRIEEARRLEQAAALESAGHIEEAAELIEKEVFVPPVQLASTTPKTTSAIREEWDFAIVDEAAIPREYLIVDEKAIRKVVKALGEKASIPGVKTFKRTVVVGRT